MCKGVNVEAIAANCRISAETLSKRIEKTPDGECLVLSSGGTRYWIRKETAKTVLHALVNQ